MSKSTDRITILDSSGSWDVDLTVRERCLLRYLSELFNAKLITDDFLTGKVNISKTIDILGKEIIGLANKISSARANRKETEVGQ